MIRLGINIDHVATVRNARGGTHPDPVRAALLAERAGADGITAHLREDRRHIRDEDMWNLKKHLSVPLNFEMAPTAEMQALALDIMPHAVCLVPEKREELTTEGGLNVCAAQSELRDFILPLAAAGIRVSLFVDPDDKQVRAASDVGAQAVELHTGTYCETEEWNRDAQLNQIIHAATIAQSLGMECHAGHGLDYDTAAVIAAIDPIIELNIGHFLMGEAMFIGLEAAIRKMRTAISSSAS